MTASSPESEQWRRRYVAPQKQRGLYSVLVPIFLGNLANESALALADFLAPFGEDVLRATIDQNLCLRNIPEALLGNVHALVKGLAPLASEPRFPGSSVACTGASTCKLGICLLRGALAAVLKKLKASDLDLDRVADLRMNLSGCPNTCGAHMAADLGEIFGEILTGRDALQWGVGLAVVEYPRHRRFPLASRVLDARLRLGGLGIC